MIKHLAQVLRPSSGAVVSVVIDCNYRRSTKLNKLLQVVPQFSLKIVGKSYNQSVISTIKVT